MTFFSKKLPGPSTVLGYLASEINLSSKGSDHPSGFPQAEQIIAWILDQNTSGASNPSPIREIIGKSHLAEIRNLSSESNTHIFFQELFSWAQRLQRDNQWSTAALVYSLFTQTEDNPFREYLLPRVPQDLRERARENLQVLSGGGPLGRRLEFQAQRFVQGATAPAMIVGMAVGSTVFTSARSLLLPRLMASRSSSLLTTGFGARLTSSSLALVPEVGAFWITSKGIEEYLHPGRQAWDAQSNLRELAALGLTLGLLKSTGFAFGRGHQWAAHLNRSGRAGHLTQAMAGGSLPHWHQTGMWAGISLAHSAEILLGWRQPQSFGSFLTDSLITLAQFNIGGRLSQGFFPGLYRFNAQLNQGMHFQEQQQLQRIQEIRTLERLQDFINRGMGPPGNGNLILSHAGTGSRRLVSKVWEAEINTAQPNIPEARDFLMTMSDHRDPNGSQPKGIPERGQIPDSTPGESNLGDLIESAPSKTPQKEAEIPQGDGEFRWGFDSVFPSEMPGEHNAFQEAVDLITRGLGQPSSLTRSPTTQGEAKPTLDLNQLGETLRWFTFEELQAILTEAGQKAPHDQILNRIVTLAVQSPGHPGRHSGLRLLNAFHTQNFQHGDLVWDSLKRIARCCQVNPTVLATWENTSEKLRSAHPDDGPAFIEAENRLQRTGFPVRTVDDLIEMSRDNNPEIQRSKRVFNLVAANLANLKGSPQDTFQHYLQVQYLVRRISETGDLIRARTLINQGIQGLKATSSGSDSEANLIIRLKNQETEIMSALMNLAILDSPTLENMLTRYQSPSEGNLFNPRSLIRLMRQKAMYHRSRGRVQQSDEILQTSSELLKITLLDPLLKGIEDPELRSSLEVLSDQILETARLNPELSKPLWGNPINDLGNTLIMAGNFRTAYEVLRAFHQMGFGDPMAYMNIIVSGVSETETLLQTLRRNNPESESIAELEEVRDLFTHWEEKLF